MSTLLMSLRLTEASSSDCPPDKNTIPGRAGTMVLERVLTVNQAISLDDFLSGHSDPGVTMFGLRRHPSMITFWSCSAFMHAAKTLSETSAHTSIV